MVIWWKQGIQQMYFPHLSTCIHADLSIVCHSDIFKMCILMHRFYSIPKNYGWNIRKKAVVGKVYFDMTNLLPCLMPMYFCVRVKPSGLSVSLVQVNPH